MQALAEGFTLLKHSEFDLDLKKVANLYNHTSVIESRLVGWMAEGFEKFGQDMEGVSGTVAHSGEGDWAVDVAKELGVPALVIENAVKFRVDSQDTPNYTGKLLQAIRNRFGGHKA
jgi:6-phosphogluconate dehydrogenase